MTEWTLIGRIGHHLHGEDRILHSAGFDRKANHPAAPVDDVTDPRDSAPRPVHNRDHFADRTARRYNIFTDEHSLALPDLKPPPQLHHALAPLRKKRPDIQLPTYLLPYHNPSKGRGNHRINAAGMELRRDVAAQELAEPGVLEHFCTLKILVAVETGRQSEMPFKESAGLPERGKNLF